MDPAASVDPFSISIVFVWAALFLEIFVFHFTKLVRLWAFQSFDKFQIRIQTTVFWSSSLVLIITAI
jgi:hypothetical protein